MNIDYKLFNNTQLADAIDSLMDRAERDEAMRAELAAQLENIYNTLADPSFRDLFGALDAAIDNHIALSDSLDSRAALLDALMAEYGKRMAMAMATSRRRLGPQSSGRFFHLKSRARNRVQVSFVPVEAIHLRAGLKERALRPTS